MKTFFTVKFALVPFAVFWALLGAKYPDWAIWSGLALASAGNLWRAAGRDFFGLEAGGLALFALLAGALLVSHDWTAANALWLSFAGLGAAAGLAAVAPPALRNSCTRCRRSILRLRSFWNRARSPLRRDIHTTFVRCERCGR